MAYSMNKFCWKLQRLKGCLRYWNHHVFGNVQDNVLKVEEHVAVMEVYFDETSLEDNCISLNRAPGFIILASCDEEIFYKQKLQVKWLKEEDQNT